MSVIEVEQIESPIRVVDPKVERSARILDEIRPGWADKVNLDDFDIQNPHRCVLAHVYKRRAFGSRVNGYVRGMNDLSKKGYNSFELAFFDPKHNDDWRLEIQARKTR